MSAKLSLPTQIILKSPVTALCFWDQMKIIMKWANGRESRTVCVANVHMLMEAYKNSRMADVLEQADLVTPDGMPLVWMMRQMGTRDQDRVAGLDIFLALCQLA